MEEKKYMELLLVKPFRPYFGIKSAMVLCESCQARKGDMVIFGESTEEPMMGVVEMVAWVGAENDDIVTLIREAGTVWEAREVYQKGWENKKDTPAVAG